MTRTLLFVLCAINCAAQTKKTLQHADIIIRHVNIISIADSAPKKDQCVCIIDNKISFIGDDKLPEKLQVKAQVIAANDKYLMPGMAEMHVHLPRTAAAVKRMMTMNLAAGVTTVRSMRGHDGQFDYKNDRSYPHPDLFLASPIITDETNLTEKGADSVVKKFKKDGWDMIKVIDIKDSLSFVRLMKYAHKAHMPVCGHMLYNLKLETLIKNGYSTVEHLGGYEDAYIKDKNYYNKLVSLTKQYDIYQCPTLDWYRVFYHQIPEEQLKNRFGLQYMPDTVKEEWHDDIVNGFSKLTDSARNATFAKYSIKHQNKLAIIKQMSDQNINFILGAEGGDTYLVPGFTMVEEMKAFKEAGISNYKILQFATINAAKYFKQDKEWGTVAKGKRANLILLAANPLDDLDAVSKVEGVFLNGKYYSEQELTSTLN